MLAKGMKTETINKSAVSAVLSAILTPKTKASHTNQQIHALIMIFSFCASLFPVRLLIPKSPEQPWRQ